VGWKVLLGAGCLGGIGFTMSLFIAGLALEGPLSASLPAGKIGILAGSALSAVLGCVLLLMFLPKQAPSAPDGSASETE
jgi:NhaA family Na+:H+ antiporter